MLWSLIGSVVLIGVSLAMDAFAVSTTDGMVYRGLSKRKSIFIPITFGVFQALMPIIGFYVGMALQQIDTFDSFDHWIAFGLLVIIGGKMIFDGVKELLGEKKKKPVQESENVQESAEGEAGEAQTEVVADAVNEEDNKERVKKFSVITLLLQGVATSIDALFTGLSLNTMVNDAGVKNTQLWAWICVLIIGVITFCISLVGLIIGNKFGQLFKKKACIAEIIGGCVLVLLGVKMVLSGYAIIGF